ncbi:MAG TPA: glycosyltransferase family A protein [Chitinispirillaceae bacterium]|nr:glycosyltransferase family A protein [Chitinispirillaceae bacterium]
MELIEKSNDILEKEYVDDDMAKNVHLYILITPASNEEKYIEATIKSIVNQTIRPKQWIIIVNNSTDRTKTIVENWCKLHRWITCLDVTFKNERNFAIKVSAIEQAKNNIDTNIDYQYIGILDADVILPENYYEQVMDRFLQNRKLGIAGGTLFEREGKKLSKRYCNTHSVAGSIQLFRKECWVNVGNFIKLKYGGEDALAEIKARMYGWEVQSFKDVTGEHNRRTNSEGRSFFKEHFDIGVQDYYLSITLFFEIAKCIKRLSKKPAIIGSFFRFCGYFHCLTTMKKITIPKNIATYYKKEQKQMLYGFLLRKGLKEKQ